MLLRVAMVNLWGDAGNWDRRRLQLAEIIGELQPDVVLAHEALGGGQLSQVVPHLPAWDHEPHEAADRLGDGCAIAAAFLEDRQRVKVAERAALACRSHHLSLAAVHAPGSAGIGPVVEGLSAAAAGPAVVAANFAAGAPVEAAASELGFTDVLGLPGPPTWPTCPQASLAYREARWGAGGAHRSEHVRRDFLLVRGCTVQRAGMIVTPDGGPAASDHAILWADISPALRGHSPGGAVMDLPRTRAAQLIKAPTESLRLRSPSPAARAA